MKSIRIDLSTKKDMSAIPCSHCFCSGKQKAMQSAMTYGGGSIRTNDTKVKCKHCSGKGFTIL